MGVFQWGAMAELYRQGLGYSFFDYYVCTSSGAFNAAYFLTEQFEEGKRNWFLHLPQRFWKLFKNDMTALENILKREEPLDCDKIKLKREKIIIALSNIETQKADYICLNEEPDIIKVLLSCCAMPFLSAPKKLHGNFYFDGSLVGQPQIDKAYSLGGTEIWLIMMQPEGYRLSSIYWKILSLLAVFNPPLRRLLVNCPEVRNDILERIENDSNLKIIRPQGNLPIGLRSRNKKLIGEMYKLGQVAANKFLTK